MAASVQRGRGQLPMPMTARGGNGAAGAGIQGGRSLHGDYRASGEPGAVHSGDDGCDTRSFPAGHRSRAAGAWSSAAQVGFDSGAPRRSLTPILTVLAAGDRGETDAKTWPHPGPSEDDMSIYEELGVRTIINAKGPSTRLSGGFLDNEVARAMVEASRHCVDIAELEAAASRVIAEITGSEAGYVTSGAAAGLLLGTAACVTGLDPGKMNRLPDTTGMKDEIVMVRSQRNFYDHAVRGAGVRGRSLPTASRSAILSARGAPRAATCWRTSTPRACPSPRSLFAPRLSRTCSCASYAGSA